MKGSLGLMADQCCPGPGNARHRSPVKVRPRRCRSPPAPRAFDGAREDA